MSVLLIAWTGNMIAAGSALIFVPRLRRLRITTVSEFLETRYSLALRLLVAGWWILYYALFAGNEMFTRATVLSPVLHVAASSIIVFVSGGVLVYCCFAGLMATAYSAVIQCFLMIVGGLILLPLSLKHAAVGGIGGLVAGVDPQVLTFWKTGQCPASARDRHVPEQLVGQVLAQQVVLPVGVPENALAAPLGEAGVGGDLGGALGTDRDAIGVEKLLGGAEPERLFRVGAELAHGEEGWVADEVEVVSVPVHVTLVVGADAPVVVVEDQQIAAVPEGVDWARGQGVQYRLATVAVAHDCGRAPGVPVVGRYGVPDVSGPRAHRREQPAIGQEHEAGL